MKYVLIILVLCCLAYWVNENYKCSCNCKARSEENFGQCDGDEYPQVQYGRLRDQGRRQQREVQRRSRR